MAQISSAVIFVTTRFSSEKLTTVLGRDLSMSPAPKSRVVDKTCSRPAELPKMTTGEIC